MAGTALMNISARSLFASYASLQTTSHNISNANTEGYSRQTVELETAGGQFSGAGFFGKGANVKTVSRAHDALLTREAQGAAATAAADLTRAERLDRLETLFPTGESGLGYAAGELLNAFVDVANRPQDISARQVVLSRAGDVVTRFRSIGEQLQTMQADLTAEVKASLASVNAMARSVADLNGQIALTMGTGHAPNDLLDQRDALISKIGAIVQVTTIADRNGSINLFVGGGEKLVLDEEVTPLVALADEFDASRVHVGIRDVSGSHMIPDGMIAGGSVAGLLRFQSQDLVTARNLVGQLAQSLARTMNRQQALGLDLQGQPGAPIFGTAQNVVQASSANAKTASGAPLGSVSFTVADADAPKLQASAYDFRGDPTTAGAYLLTRASDGQQFRLTSGGTPVSYVATPLPSGTAQASPAGWSVDGMVIQVSGSPGARDRFQLQPVAGAALELTQVLDDPRAVAAASPLTAVAGTDNAGTATVASLQATTSPATCRTSVTFTSDTGQYNWRQTDLAGNPIAGASGTGTWTAGSTLALEGFELTLNGVPKGQVSATLNTGSAASVTSVRALAGSPGRNFDGTLSFTSASSYTWTMTDPRTSTTSSGTVTGWSAPAPIVVNGVEVVLAGTPAAGDAVTLRQRVDTFTVDPTTFPASNNGNALRFTDLRTAALVGASATRPGVTLSDGYADAMTEVGVRVQSARYTSEVSKAVSEDKQASVGEKTGVNLDEEAARMIQYQQSYQAAAKMLQVAQSIMDTLLEIAGR